MQTETKDMKPSIYGLTRDELIEWAIEHGEKEIPCNTKFGIGFTVNVSNLLKK